jgi:hypothetical protein
MVKSDRVKKIAIGFVKLLIVGIVLDRVIQGTIAIILSIFLP